MRDIRKRIVMITSCDSSEGAAAGGDDREDCRPPAGRGGGTGPGEARAGSVRHIGISGGARGTLGSGTGPRRGRFLSSPAEEAVGEGIETRLAASGRRSPDGGAGPAGLVDLGAGFLLGQDLGQFLLQFRADGRLAGQGPQGVFQLATVAGQLEGGQGAQRVRRLRGGHRKVLPVSSGDLVPQRASRGLPLGSVRAAHRERAIRSGEHDLSGPPARPAQRARLGWTQVVLGEKIGFSGSFVSDVERCERSPSRDFARACDREMGLPGTFERLQELTRRAAYPSWFYPVIPFEASAVRIHGWELGAVPGLLQTEDYARALIRVARAHDPDEVIERMVAARIDRQEIMAKDTPPLLWYVIDESVLRRVVGGPPVMAAELDQLITIGSRPGAVIQVLTFAAGEGIGADGPISVYEFADAASVCYTECYRGGRVIEDHAEVAEMMTKVNMIRVSALSPRASVELIRQIRSQIDDQP